MAIRKYKPTTPGRRGASVSTFDEITRATPEKSLVAKGRNKAGRNNKGRIRIDRINVELAACQGEIGRGGR